MIDILIKGGPVMIPLLLCSVLGVGVTLERAWYLYRTRIDSEELMEEIKLAFAQGKILEAIQIAKRARGPIRAVCASGIASYDRPRPEIESNMNRAGQEEVSRMERRLPILDTIITISPLLGLLGTVTGIIKSFRILASLQGIEQPSALSIGVAEALITTAAGLIIAIPALAVYNWLSAIVDRRVAQMNVCSSELLELFESRSDG